jgi:cysteine desulfurase/selenocysteine lyase
MRPQEIRKDFPILQENPGLAYLDNAATSQKPREVIRRLETFYTEENSNVGRGVYDLASTATQVYEDSRQTIADFIGANKDEIVFVRNTTEAENLLAESMDVEGEVVLNEMAHHSEQLPWRRATGSSDNFSFIDTEDGRLSVDSAEKEIAQDTEVVVISHVSNVFGVENPVEEITEIAHENSAKVILDAAQSVPHTSVDVKELEVEFLTFSGHKMLGPTGIGVLYGKKQELEELGPYQIGGGMVQSVEKRSVSYTQPPQRFEAGTPNIAGAAGMAEAARYLQDVGMGEIEAHDRKLCERIREGLTGIEGLEVVSPQGAVLVSFETDFAHPHDVAQVLDERDVAVRAGNHCAQPQMREINTNGTTRASPYLYNTEEDVERLIEAVKEAKEVFS